MVSADVLMLVAGHGVERIMFNNEVSVASYKLLKDVLDADVLVLLGLDEYLFGAFLVLKPQLVETAAAFVRIAFDRALGFFSRQVVRGHRSCIINPPGYDWAVGVALDEIDNNFLSDSRNEHGSPSFSRPVLGDADPARAFVVVLTFAVPVELDLYPSILVDVDLLAGGADYYRGLGSMDHRYRGGARCAEWQRMRHALELIDVGEVRSAASIRAPVIGSGIAGVIYRHQSVRLVEVAAIMIVEIKAIP